MKHKVIADSLVKMGNVCSSNNNNKSGAGGKPPRDLTSLVEELVLSEKEETLWGSQFRQFLKHRGQKDLEHALDFVTSSSRLSTAQDQAKNTENKTKQAELKEKRVSLLNQMGTKYFKADSDQCLPLANQVLHEELSEKLSKVNEKSSEAQLDEAVALVMQARSDNKIWKSGLDISYKTFLANKPSPTMKSVLLSIL